MRTQHSSSIILVGQSSLLREGVARILRAANFSAVASVSCPDEVAASKLSPQQSLFLIVHADADFNVVTEQIDYFRENYPDGRIAIVTDRYRLGELVSAFRAGASGYFVDVMMCDVFIKSIELVMMGEAVLPPALLPYVLRSEPDQPDDTNPREGRDAAILLADNTIASQLSPRERLILRCLIEGDSNKAIARKIDIAEATVKVHVKAILRKIRVQNRTQAAIWGMNNACQSKISSAVAPTISPSLTHRMPSRLPNLLGPASDVDRNGVPLSPDWIEHEASRPELPRPNHLIRNDTNPRIEANIRPRK